METTNFMRTKTDLLTSILGVLVILWVLALYTYALIQKDIEFTFFNCLAFLGFGAYLIWFKGDSARETLLKGFGKLKELKK